VMYTDRRSSELIKYASNAFLAMKVTFINEIADLCEAVGANVQQVARGVGFDKRIGPKFLHAGPGYGGSCFPKDTLALTRTARDAEAPLRLVETTMEVNDARKRRMAGRVAAAFGGELTGSTIGVLGLTYKPNTDDMRDAPSLEIVPALQALGAVVQAYDPAAREARQLLPGVDFKPGPYEALEGADCAVIITEWDEFRALDLDRVKEIMRRPLMVDLRNVYKPEELRPRGFTYVSIGRR
jgi:UDPglucose 6-dehydrogenase